MPHILLTTDIFGYTKATEAFKYRLESICEAVHVIDPYDAKQMDFQNEDEAYEAFSRLCGLENYAKRCMKALDAHTNETLILIGFSMGASAFWNVLDGRESANVKSFFGFYSSQIRHFLDAKPRVPCTLIFPTFEKHFDVDEVIIKLAKQENITCVKTEYLHGFMNPLSVNYNAISYAEYCQWVEEKIKVF